MQYEQTFRVFIYGSLLPGLSNRQVVEPYIVSTSPGRIGGRIVDIGPYPALVRSGGLNGEFASSVRGCWIAVTCEGLKNMDTLEEFHGIEEDNDYDRIWVSDLDDPGLEGWVYVWPDSRGFPYISSDYWPDYYNSKKR
ncbi:gamma-glutamylcyclotransferase [Paenibacillus tarimensis]